MNARRTMRIRLGQVAALCVAVTFIAVTMLQAATGDTIADIELGEPDFLHSAAVNVNGVSSSTGNGYGLSGPTALATDSAGHLYVADTANNRVLGWHDEAALVTGQSADLVVGQVDLYSVGSGGGPDGLSSPTGVAVDSNGNLYVSDSGNKPRAGVQRAVCSVRRSAPVHGRSRQYGFRPAELFPRRRLQFRRIHHGRERRFSMHSARHRGRQPRQPLYRRREQQSRARVQYAAYCHRGCGERRQHRRFRLWTGRERYQLQHLRGLPPGSQRDQPVHAVWRRGRQ